MAQGFYPIRERSRLISEFKLLTEQLMMLKAFVAFPGDIVCIYFSLFSLVLTLFNFIPCIISYSFFWL